jgi:pyruvate kinase
MRRTKILATLGPASARPDVLDGMLKAGLDAVRLNFSHGTHASHAATYTLVREAAKRAGRHVAVLQDLQGPKIRIGKVRPGGIDVPTGSVLVITTRRIEGVPGLVPTDHLALPRDVRPGHRILLDEGRLAVVVREVRGEDVVCDVTDGGLLSSNKGLSVPGASLTAEAMTDKDREDARFGLALGVDFVALSFVRRGGDIGALRALMAEVGRAVPIVAKIEHPTAIEHLDEVVAAADGLMVARGDLAIETSLELVPIYQKLIIERTNRAGKLVITATQMLESMTDQPLPTRAEVSDVANAVLDGTDAVMLSGETAVGSFPVETVRRMASICEATEERLYPFDRPVRARAGTTDDLALSVVRLAGHAAREAGPKALVVCTASGQSAQSLSDERPRAPILAITHDEGVANRLALYWGVLPRRVGEVTSAAQVLTVGERLLRAEGLAGDGDLVVVLLGANAAPDHAHAVELVRLA